MTRSQLSAYLAEHPRMMGVLFTAGLLVLQAQSVMANAGTANSGP